MDMNERMMELNQQIKDALARIEHLTEVQNGRVRENTKDIAVSKVIQQQLKEQLESMERNSAANHGEIKSRISELGAKMEIRFAELDARIDKMNTGHHTRMDKIEKEVSSLLPSAEFSSDLKEILIDNWRFLMLMMFIVALAGLTLFDISLF